VLQTWTLDGSQEAEVAEVTRAEIRKRHPELESIITRRDEEEAAQLKLQNEWHVRAQKEQERRYLDMMLRLRNLTVEQYLKAVKALDAKFDDKKDGEGNSPLP
jgi:hypothetical protein